jgi:uncharacterized protein YukE
MVETAQKSLQDLADARYPVDGIEEGLQLLDRAASSEGWLAGNWRPLARAEDYLVAELHETRAELRRLADAGKVQQAKLDRVLTGLEDRWSREEEERFQKDLEKFKKDIEPPEKKYLRLIWKLCGDKALESAVAGLPALLGAGPLAAVGVLAAKFAVKFLGKKLGAALGEP